jgi:peptidoglycan/xylan/chitin deacetylase (PgdA/CDA1 family)
LKVPGLKSLRLSARWLRSRLGGHALILGYHRIAEVAQDPYGICVAPRNFAEQLKVLSQTARVLGLQELVEALKVGAMPERAVVITFDDGYAETFYNAMPLLETYQVPATVFVVGGNLSREFWWDALERMVYSMPGLLEKCHLSVNGKKFEWEARGSEEDKFSGNDSRDKRRLLLLLYHFLMSLTNMERDEAMTRLWAWSGSDALAQPICSALSAEEILDLADSGLMEVGSHTMAHPVLAELFLEDQKREIRGSKDELERLLKREVRCFSYPHGSVSEETLKIVENAGFGCACASHNDVVRRGSNPFCLPRFWVPDWDGRRFSRWINTWISR